MAEENKLQFGFDTSFFEKGINKAMGKLGEMEGVTKSVTKGMIKGLTNVVGKIGIVAGAVKLVKGAIANMPEIGQVLGITKDIFTRNLLYPIRKELFPILQKLLNWVRDSQVRFVKWGETIVGVFKFVIKLATKVIDLIKKITGGLSDFIERTFGISIKSIEDLFNIIAFKVAVIAEFVRVVIDRVISGAKGLFAEIDISGLETTFHAIIGYLESIFNFVKEIAFEFAGGFLDSIKGIKEPIASVFNSIIGILGNMYEMATKVFDSEKAEKWGDVFRKIGEVYGVVVLSVIEGIAAGLEKIDEWLTSINEKGFKDWFSDTRLGEGIQNFFNKEEAENGGGSWGIRKVNDAILRPNGEIIETSPEDTLVALKSTGTSMAGISKQIGSVIFDFSGMQILVPEGSTPEFGAQIGNSMIDQIRNEWNRDKERFGL